jgi:hypothetical protein
MEGNRDDSPHLLRRERRTEHLGAAKLCFETIETSPKQANERAGNSGYVFLH